MADISSCLQKILEAVYGEEVRGSIHDALAAMNVESNSAMEYAHTAKDSATASAALAKASEEIAVQKAEEIVSSSEAARLSEENAKRSETNAAAKAEEAGSHADAAKASETNAANSEAAALQKASEAEASKNAAAVSESNALAAEERVKVVKGEVEILGAQTTADRNAAEAAKTEAESSKNAAAASAASAAQSELAASAAKTEAESSKNAAEEAREAAETAKAEAEAARDLAKASETAAKASEENAAQSADTARQYSGKPAIVDDTTKTWWIWNADEGKYEDTGKTSEIPGPTGNGIQSIEHTSGDHMPGTTDVYTVTMTDGSSMTISVYNGKNGTGVGDLVGIGFDVELPVEGWKDGECTISDSRFVASSRYKYFVDAYDECRDEVKDSVIRPKDITITGQITFTSEFTPLTPVTVNVLRVEVASSGTA